MTLLIFFSIFGTPSYEDEHHYLVNTAGSTFCAKIEIDVFLLLLLSMAFFMEKQVSKTIESSRLAYQKYLHRL